LSDAEVSKIGETYHAWRGEPKAGEYQDIRGFCATASVENIKGYNYVLTPGRYVGAADAEEDDVPFSQRFATLKQVLSEQLAKSERLSATIQAKLDEVESNG
jgi:type I restriction enzyme M protein